jgi:hypothetical protein
MPKAAPSGAHLLERKLRYRGAILQNAEPNTPLEGRTAVKRYRMHEVRVAAGRTGAVQELLRIACFALGRRDVEDVQLPQNAQYDTSIAPRHQAAPLTLWEITSSAKTVTER